MSSPRKSTGVRRPRLRFSSVAEKEAHLEKLREEENRLMHKRLSKVIDEIQTARRKFLAAYCGIVEACPGVFSCDIDVEEHTEAVLAKYGHKKGLHDDRPAHYAKTICPLLLDAIEKSAHETFASFPTTTEGRRAGCITLQLEMLHTLLSARFMGKKRARESDVISARVFAKADTPKATAFAVRVCHLVSSIGASFGVSFELKDRPTLVVAIRSLRERCLPIFCQCLADTEACHMSDSGGSPTASDRSVGRTASVGSVASVSREEFEKAMYCCKVQYEAQLMALQQRVLSLENQNRALKEQNEKLEASTRTSELAREGALWDVLPPLPVLPAVNTDNLTCPADDLMDLNDSPFSWDPSDPLSQYSVPMAFTDEPSWGYGAEDAPMSGNAF